MPPNSARWIICRFCLAGVESKLTGIFIPVYTLNNRTITATNATIKRMLKVLNMKISYEDEYPNLICHDCRNVLFGLQRFLSRSKEAKLQFEKLISELNKHVEIRPENVEGPKDAQTAQEAAQSNEESNYLTQDDCVTEWLDEQNEEEAAGDWPTEQATETNDENNQLTEKDKDEAIEGEDEEIESDRLIIDEDTLLEDTR